MNKIILVTSFLLAILSFVNAEQTEGVYKDPNHPGKCVISPELILSPWQTVNDTSKGCGRIMCLADSEVVFQSCKLHDEIPYCPDGMNFGYPDCCVLCLPRD